ncbi:MAG TPA: 3-hydroxyacyl-CoA dehydrogenase family protein [Nitriliruptorales bacterium]
MEVQRVGVMGAGVMGSGIAQSIATAGIETVGYDISSEQLDRARRTTVEGRYGIDRGVERGKLTEEQGARAKQLLTFTGDLDTAVRGADLVIEAVDEDMGLKVRVFRQLDELTPEHAILATNSSGHPVAALAAVTQRPASVIGWHWASPPPVRPFAEIVVHDRVSDHTRDTVVELARRCGKNPIVVRENDRKWGYAMNRVLWAAIDEARQVVAEELCTAEELDQLMVDCLDWPVGPFVMLDGASRGW